MKTREETTISIVSSLQQIKTIDDLKASKKTILDAMEDSFTSALNEVKAFVDQMESMNDEEVKSKGGKFFEDDYWDMPPEMEKEMDRLMSLPGGEEYLDTLEPDLETMIGPIMSEFETYGEKLSNRFFGGVIDAFEEAAENIEGEMEKLKDSMNEEEEEKE